MGFARRWLFLPLMQLNKSIKNFINYFLGPLLFVWLLFSIYQQLAHQPHLQKSWQHIQQSFGSRKVMCLLAVILLMLINWALEAVKWKLSVTRVYPVSFFQAFKAVLSGVSFSVTMPNRMGEYAGRMLYLPEGSRLKTIAVAMVGSISQLWMTLVSGGAGLLVLKEDLLQAGLLSDIWYRIVLGGVVAVVLILTLLYFGVPALGKWIEKWFASSRYLYLIQSLKTFNVQLLLFLLLLSFLRYIVFVSQYFLLFSLFEVHVPAPVVWSVMSVVFLTMAVVPTVALVEIGLKGKISLQLMGLFTVNGLGVVLTSVTVWFINLIVPALAGSILILGIKVFKRKHETTV